MSDDGERPKAASGFWTWGLAVGLGLALCTASCEGSPGLEPPYSNEGVNPPAGGMTGMPAAPGGAGAMSSGAGGAAGKGGGGGTGGADVGEGGRGQDAGPEVDMDAGVDDEDGGAL